MNPLFWTDSNKCVVQLLSVCHPSDKPRPSWFLQCVVTRAARIKQAAVICAELRGMPPFASFCLFSTEETLRWK